MERCFNLFTVLKKLKECVGFFFFNNLIATNGRGYEQLSVACAMERIAYSLCYVGVLGF